MAVNAETEIDRKPHASRDLSLRDLKALKVECLLDGASCSQPIRMRDAGTGSWDIAQYFGTHSTIGDDLNAVGVHDNPAVTDGYRCHQLHDTYFPFPNESFGIVLTNYLMELVGEADVQHPHRAEG